MGQQDDDDVNTINMGKSIYFLWMFNIQQVFQQ